MSVSTTATRRPEDARHTARFAVRLDFPVPPRYEWMETILATSRALRRDSARDVGASRVARGKHLGPGLQLLKVVRFGDLGDLGDLSILVDGDDELFHLSTQPALAGSHFDAHTLKQAGQVAERVRPLADLV